MTLPQWYMQDFFFWCFLSRGITCWGALLSEHLTARCQVGFRWYRGHIATREICFQFKHLTHMSLCAQRTATWIFCLTCGYLQSMLPIQHGYGLSKCDQDFNRLGRTNSFETFAALPSGAQCMWSPVQSFDSLFFASKFEASHLLGLVRSPYHRPYPWCAWKVKTVIVTKLLLLLVLLLQLQTYTDLLNLRTNLL